MYRQERGRGKKRGRERDIESRERGRGNERGRKSVVDEIEYQDRYI